MAAEAPKIPEVPLTKLRRRSPGGFEVVACAKDAEVKESLVTPGDFVIWTCVAGTVVLIVWMVFGIGHAIGWVYRSVSTGVDVKSISQDIKSLKPEPVDGGVPAKNLDAADVEMNRKSEEIKKNFNDSFGSSLGRFFEATKSMKVPEQKHKEVGTF